LTPADLSGHVARAETGWASGGRRFTHSPWHRSAKRAGVTGLWSPLHMVSGRTPVYRPAGYEKSCLPTASIHL